MNEKDLTDDEKLLVEKYRDLKEGIFGSLSVKLESNGTKAIIKTGNETKISVARKRNRED